MLYATYNTIYDIRYVSYMGFHMAAIEDPVGVESAELRAVGGQRSTLGKLMPSSFYPQCMNYNIYIY